MSKCKFYYRIVYIRPIVFQINFVESRFKVANYSNHVDETQRFKYRLPVDFLWLRSHVTLIRPLRQVLA